MNLESGYISFDGTRFRVLPGEDSYQRINRTLMVPRQQVDGDPRAAGAIRRRRALKSAAVESEIRKEMRSHEAQERIDPHFGDML